MGQFAAPSPFHIENDMCLFQWGRHGSEFECDFTRQVVLHDRDGDYDHMEHVSLTLLFAPSSDVAELGSGEISSGADLDSWARDVAEHPVLRVLSARPPMKKRLSHTEV